MGPVGSTTPNHGGGLKDLSNLGLTILKMTCEARNLPIKMRITHFVTWVRIDVPIVGGFVSHHQSPVISVGYDLSPIVG